LSQLALPLQLDDYAVFESFWKTGNESLHAFLQNLVTSGEGPGCWIWGPPSTGKTHLLQAACERLGDRSVYLPLELLLQEGPAILEGVAARRFVCIDNIERCAGNEHWELALFGLCNQLLDSGGTLVASAQAAPRECAFGLPDLQSRLALLPAFRLQVLAETDRINALQLRSRHRGLELPAETARFLLSRSRRDMASLYRLLDRLDAEALRAQRRLTIPFVKSVLLD
jgi:DnaA family protein